MMRRALSGIAMMAIAAAVACDCEGAGSAGSEVPSGSSIQITQISPGPSSRLHVGERVDLQVTAAYILTAETGAVILVVQAADNSSIAYLPEVIQKGSGTVTLKASFVVPQTGSIVVYVPLSVEDQNETATVDARAYKVEALGSSDASGSSIQITQASPESTIGPSIQITHISPESSSRVHVGDRVDLEVTASYTQAAESGSITLVVQAADGSTIANLWEVVARGSGTVTLKTSFVVPETSSIGVFMPLSAEGQGVTSTVDARTYIVEAK